MPIWLRKFTFNKIKEYHDSQNKNTQAEDSWTNQSKSQNIKVPDYISKSPQPYQTKASRK